MGDRICLSIVNDELQERSPCLYAHWAGMDLLDYIADFWSEHHDKIRAEPSNVMVNFISWLREGKVQDGSYYIYKDEDSACSPDDNGYWEFDTVTGTYREYRRHVWEKK